MGEYSECSYFFVLPENLSDEVKPYGVEVWASEVSGMEAQVF